jgi:tRNA threonylcarbamoyladenosine biosynthesis protein TsaB
MKILALELSSAKGSIAWCEDTRDPFNVSFANDRKDSGLFFENLEACVSRFGKADRIVVGLGPGSYAGTRIAIATATGLAAATGAKLVGLSSLRAIETVANDYAVIGDARRQSFFFARVSERGCTEGPTLYSAEALAEHLSDISCPVYAAEALTFFPAVELAYPSAPFLAQIAAFGAAEMVSPLEPIYLREPHITATKHSPFISSVR